MTLQELTQQEWAPNKELKPFIRKTIKEQVDWDWIAETAITQDGNNWGWSDEDCCWYLEERIRFR